MKSLTALSIVLALLFQAKAAFGQPFTRDTSFGLDMFFFGPGSEGRVWQIFELPDNKLLVTGSFKDGNKKGMVRFFANGSHDPSFQVPINFNNQQTLYVAPSNYGYWVMYDLFYIMKVNYNGQHIDPAYTQNLQYTDLTHCPFSRPYMLYDGSFIAGSSQCGYPSNNPYRWMNLIRVLPNGHVDTTFQHDTDGVILHTLRYNNDKIIVAGGFNHYDSIPITRICRIDTLGNFDSTFHSIFTSGLVAPIHIQPDGKILVVGEFTIQNHTGTLGLVRLNSDGSPDSTFNNFNTVSPSTDGGVGAVCSTSDGGYLIGGSFTSYQGVPKGRLAKTDANGFLEPQYFTGSGIDAPSPLTPWNFRVHTIVRGSNDQYYVGGVFSGFNGETVQPIIRLNGPETVGIQPAESKKAAISVQPNPAREYTSINWELPLLQGNATLVITNVVGSEVSRHSISGKKGAWVWDTRNQQPGLYLYKLVQDGKQLTNGKIAVVK